MNTLDEIAIRIAERVAPEEVDLAPAIARAAAAGDREWAQALRQSDQPVLGGVLDGGVDAGTLLAIFNALRAVIGELANWTTVISVVVGVAAHIRAWRTAASMPAISSDVATSTNSTLEAVANELQRQGFEPGRAEETSRRILEILAEAPAKSQAFLSAIARKP